MFSSEMYPVGSKPEALIIQTIAGFRDPSDQQPDIPPTVVPWNSYGMGMVGYSMSLLSTNVLQSKLGYIDSPAPYISPLVDGASLRTTLPYFGDWMNNVFEYRNITGTRMQLPFESVLSVPPPYLQFEPLVMSVIRAPLYAAKTSTAAASLTMSPTTVAINMRGSSCMETPFQYMVRYPSCHDYIFVELGERVKGREYLALNWQFNGAPLTNTTQGMDPYLVGWGVTPVPSGLAKGAASSYTPGSLLNNGMILLWQAALGLYYGAPSIYTQLVHLYSHETFRVGIDGIKRMDAAF